MLGCILAELAIGCQFFVGDNDLSQLVEIVRVLGSISKADIDVMATVSGDQLEIPPSLGHRAPEPWSQVLTVELPNRKCVQTSYGATYESLLAGLLKWSPASRHCCQEILTHPVFDGLKAPSSAALQPLQMFD